MLSLKMKNEYDISITIIIIIIIIKINNKITIGKYNCNIFLDTSLNIKLHKQILNNIGLSDPLKSRL
jgi:hypothetical protein